MFFRGVVTALVVATLLSGAACADQEVDPRAKIPEDEPRYSAPQIVGRIQIEDLMELSGLTASIERPGRLWAHNDSGGDPILFCMRRSGASCGRVRLRDAESVDWEDIAIRRVGDEGTLYVADIGDNERVRDFITIYRLAEPTDGTRAASAERFDLSFPRRAFDAEAIIVEPKTEDLYVVTKDFAGRPDVFVARGPLGSHPTLEPVGSVSLAGPVAVVTGASLAPTGDRIVLSTYASGYELALPEGEPFDEIWSQTPIAVPLGSHPQGEAVAYLRSGDIVSGSEGLSSPIYAVEYLARP